MNIGLNIGIVFMLMVVVTQSIFILSWTPVLKPIVVFLMSTGFAFSQSIAASQIRGNAFQFSFFGKILIQKYHCLGLYGVYFPNNNSAFSAAAMGFTLGLSLGSACSAYFCTSTKILIYLIIVVLSLVCYVIICFRHNNVNTKVQPIRYETNKITLEQNAERF